MLITCTLIDVARGVNVLYHCAKFQPYTSYGLWVTLVETEYYNNNDNNKKKKMKNCNNELLIISRWLLMQI